MPKENFLPREALPGLIHLLDAFKNVLTGEIKGFEDTGDILELRRAVLPLRKDLDSYKENFEAWYQNAQTAEDYQDLEKLAKHLGQAQELVSQAEQLLKT